MTTITNLMRGIASLALACTICAQAQSLPADLQKVTVEQASALSDLGVGGLYSIANYPNWPPLPFAVEFVGDCDLFYSQTANGLYYDDRALVAERLLSTGEMLPPPDGDTNSVPDGTNYVYSVPIPPWTTNFSDLFLEMVAASANPPDLGHLVLHNSQANRPYRLWSAENVTNAWPSGWSKERVFLGAEGTTNTDVWVFIKWRTNTLFFRAEQLSEANYTVIARLADGQTNASAYVNGALTSPEYIAETLVGFTGEIGSLNLGLESSYDWTGLKWSSASFTDDRPFHLNYWLEPPWRSGYEGSFPTEMEYPPAFYNGQALNGQPTVEIALSRSALNAITNLCLSRNYSLTSLDVHNSSSIQDIEAHACTELAYAKVTGCPNLWRVCFEGVEGNSKLTGPLDFTGCAALQEIRCANNPGVNNLVLGGLSNLWHLCVHDSGLVTNLNLSDLTSLQDLWIWNCNQSGALEVPSTDLYDVRIETYNTSFLNNYSFINFENKSHLYRLIAYQNQLTNCVLTGCTNLSEVDLRNNALSTEAIDSVIAQLAWNATNGGRCPRVLVISNQVGGATMSLNGYNDWLALTSKAAQTYQDGNTYFAADIPAALVPPSLSGIMELTLSGTEEAITWTTSVESTNNVVDYGTNTDYGLSVVVEDSSTTHSNYLSGLTAGTNYYYRVRSTSVVSGMSVTNAGCFVAGYIPSWEFVQSAYSTDGGSVTITAGTNDLLVAYVHSSDTTTGVSDNRNNAWIQITNNASCGSAGNIRMYYVAGCAGGTTTIAGSGYSLHVLEFNGGTSGAVELDAAMKVENASTSYENRVCSIGPLTVASSNCLIVAGEACYQGPLTSGEGFNSPNGDRRGFVEYKIGVNSTNAVTATVNDGAGSDQYGMIMASFKRAN